MLTTSDPPLSLPLRPMRVHGMGHWITSFARASSDGGIVRPRALAVLRLMTSSNSVGRSTGRSAGLAPLRIKSTPIRNSLHVSESYHGSRWTASPFPHCLGLVGRFDRARLTTIFSLGPAALFTPRAGEAHDCEEPTDDVSVPRLQEEGQRDWAGTKMPGVAAIAKAAGAVRCRHR